MGDVRVCNVCKSETDKQVLDRNFSICPKCGNYLRVHARRRIGYLSDSEEFTEWDDDLTVPEVNKEEEYISKLSQTAKKHNLNEAIITGEIDICGCHTAIGVMDTRFMMASMGQVVGEKITRLFERATKKKLPVLLFCCSGGARIQEGIVSLMQMEKTSAAVKKHSDKGLLYISVLTNPTMGGVTASFAMIADIVLAEKGAMIGFAGKRVIEQNTGEKLPDGFQTAEFQLKNGFVDAIVPREYMKDYIGRLLCFHERKRPRRISRLNGNSLERMTRYRGTVNHLSGWEKVQIVRANDRPTCMDFIKVLFDDFEEFAGDRVCEDDKSIIAGIARYNDRYVTVIGEQKGKKSVQDAIYRNWGMPSPSGYRKALRIMKQAEKFNRPIICFIDTIGAACGRSAEEQGQGLAIAKLLLEMSTLKVPILSIVLSEGGSGGALALGIGNEVWMMENAIYSVLTPEGYASILWKDNSKAKEAADSMRMGAIDLLQMQVIDKVITEEKPITVKNIMTVKEEFDEKLEEFFMKYERMSPANLVKSRYQRFRKI